MRVPRTMWVIGAVAVAIVLAVVLYLASATGPAAKPGGPPAGTTPTPIVSPPPSGGETSKNTDVDKLAACVRAANQDPVKLQECAKRR